MRQITIIALLATTIFMPSIFAQVTYTANDTITPYNNEFLYGTNPGYYNTAWNDIAKSDIARGYNTLGANARSLRPNLPHDFLERYGYNIRLTEFAHYKTIGMKDHTVFLGTYFDVKSTDPVHIDFIKKNMDSTKYGGCANYPQSYKRLYEPIWDGGANGTPVNENNPFALYIFKTVSNYKDHVKFWEIINEPDFCGSKSCEDAPGVAGNWWQNPPQPCDLINFRAPLFHYIRMLRIAYEVIKTVSPNSYVALGGIGYKSFLDVLLRYTDNPAGGTVSPAYPLAGGAYFDVVSYHCYPQYNLRTWDNAISNFKYSRYSDAVADSVIAFKNNYIKILNKYGYDGKTFPKKHFIMTEFNIPRKQYAGQDYIGSPDAQKNAMIKTLVKCQKEDIKQVYTFQLGDTREETDATSTDWHHLMGLFKNLVTNKPGEQQLTISGIGFKTTSEILEGYRYDASKTSAMGLTTGTEGAAFKNSAGKYQYVLWARTATDMSENATGTYTFPASFKLVNVDSYEWNYSITKTKANRSASNISLTGSPLFISEGIVLGLSDESGPGKIKNMFVYPNPNQGQFSLITSGLQGPASVKIYKLNGTLVNSYQTNITDGTVIENQFQLDKGVYFVHLLSNNSSEVGKVIIE